MGGPAHIEGQTAHLYSICLVVCHPCNAPASIRQVTWDSATPAPSVLAKRRVVPVESHIRSVIELPLYTERYS